MLTRSRSTSALWLSSFSNILIKKVSIYASPPTIKSFATHEIRNLSPQGIYSVYFTEGMLLLLELSVGLRHRSQSLKTLLFFYPSVATLSYFARWNEHGTTWVFYIKEIMKSHLNYSAYLYKEKCTHQVHLICLNKKIHKEKSIFEQRDMSQRFEIAWQTALSKLAWWLIITREFCLFDKMHQITARKKDRANNCSICTPRKVERHIYDSGIIASVRGFWNSLPFSWQMQKFPEQLNKRFQKISPDNELNGTVTSQPLSPPINLRF